MEQENKNESFGSFDKAQNKSAQDKPVKEIHHHHYKKPGSFFGRLVWGLVVIFIGLIFLAQNVGLVPPVQVGAFFATFWPVFIILAGLSILARGGWVLGVISSIIMLAIFALLFAWFLGAPVFSFLSAGEDKWPCRWEIGQERLIPLETRERIIEQNL